MLLDCVKAGSLSAWFSNNNKKNKNRRYWPKHQLLSRVASVGPWRKWKVFKAETDLTRVCFCNSVRLTTLNKEQEYSIYHSGSVASSRI